jgi:FkbM family methyltransferase
MERVYYSQDGEDKFLNDNYFHNKRNGIYVELGALDGVLYSNTKFFEDKLNWKGILIEPNPYKFHILKQTRPNNFLSNSLVSSETEAIEFKFFVDGHAAVSGVTKTLPASHYEHYFDKYPGLPNGNAMIKPHTFTEIITASNVKHIDLLSLDVEGHEYEVLKSWDFSVPIDVILIELLQTDKERDEKCRKILQENGYVFDKRFGRNEVFLLKK